MYQSIKQMVQGRSLLEICYLIICTIRTRIFFKNCRLIRFPIQIRGKSNIVFSSGFTTGKYCRLEVFNDINKGEIIFGQNCQINDNVHIASVDSVTLGDNVLIASRVFISDHNHGQYSGDDVSNPNEVPADRKLSSSPVVIEDNVWLGEGVAVMPGVRIGRGCIIGANSVVTKDLPDNTICAGVPAKVIKRYNELSGKWEKS